MRAASQLPGRGPTDVNDAPALNQNLIMMMRRQQKSMHAKIPNTIYDFYGNLSDLMRKTKSLTELKILN